MWHNCSLLLERDVVPTRQPFCYLPTRGIEFTDQNRNILHGCTLHEPEDYVGPYYPQGSKCLLRANVPAEKIVEAKACIAETLLSIDARLSSENRGDFGSDAYKRHGCVAGDESSNSGSARGVSKVALLILPMLVGAMIGGF